MDLELSPEYAAGRFLQGLAQRLSGRRGRRSKLPMLDWAARYLPHYLTKAASPLHLYLAALSDRICLGEVQGLREVCIGPRLTAKSTWLSLALPCRAALEANCRYCWLVADTATQSQLMLENLKTEIESNPQLRLDYPDATGEGPTWRDDRIVLRNGVMIEAISTGQKLRGRRHKAWRPDLIVVDDPQNDEHTDSEVMRAKSLRWFRSALLPAGSKESNVLVAGTSLHRECIVEVHMTQPGWQGRRFKSIIDWPRRMDLWAEWEKVLFDWEKEDREERARKFYQKNRKEMDAGAKVLWPESEDLYDLMFLRAQIGNTAFEAEKQSSPINPALCEWPETFFNDPEIWVNAFPTLNLCPLRAMMVDPSKGKSDKAGDFSAIVKAALGPDQYLYVDCDMARRPTDEIIETTVEQARDFDPMAVGFESNAYQEYVAETLQRHCMKADLLLPVVKVFNNVKKPVRIRRIGPYLSQKRIRFVRSPGTKLLVNQLRDFPQADHDDGPDALEGAVRILSNLARGGQRQDDGLGEGINLGDS